MRHSLFKTFLTFALAAAFQGILLAQGNGAANPQVIAAADTRAPTVENPTGGFHRHSEGSAVQLDSGRILLSWSRFYTTTTDTERDDNSPGTIVSAYSDDSGATWSTPQPMPVGTTVTAGWNLMQSAFLKLDDRLQLYYSVRERFPNVSRPTGKFLIESSDGGQTWSNRRLVTPNNIGITGPNDRMLRLSNGRIILPVHRGTDSPRVAWSDDKGATWGLTGALAYDDPWPLETAEPKVHEPTVIQRQDGSLYMLARTTRGQLAHGTSTDGGQTWTTLEPSGIPSLTSPPYMRKLEDGRVFLLWNRPTDAEVAKFPRTMPGTVKRTTLMGAISTDDAFTWSKPFVVLNDGGANAFHYPSLLELKDGNEMLLFASRSPDTINVSDLVMRRLSKAELPSQKAKQARLSYDPTTGDLWLDVGSQVDAVEIGGAGLTGASLATFGDVSASVIGGVVRYEGTGDLPFSKSLLGKLDAGLNASDLSFRWQPDGGDWTQAAVVIVPEPSATAAALMFAAAVLAQRRRRS